MKGTSAWEQMNALLNIEELSRLLGMREQLRTMYAALQTAAHATNNPLFETLLILVAKQGNAVNADIQSWFDRVQMEHGEYSDDEQE